MRHWGALTDEADQFHTQRQSFQVNVHLDSPPSQVLSLPVLSGQFVCMSVVLIVVAIFNAAGNWPKEEGGCGSLRPLSVEAAEEVRRERDDMLF